MEQDKDLSNEAQVAAVKAALARRKGDVSVRDVVTKKPSTFKK
jgi:hypothetical protein